MIPQTKQQRINTLDALNVMWPSVPPKNVIPALHVWNNRANRKRATCKTIACFGGWCAWWPNFKAQGVKAGWMGAPIIEDKTGSLVASGVAEFLFGDVDLFMSRGCHEADRHFEGSDHALVTNRLKWLLENSEVGK